MKNFNKKDMLDFSVWCGINFVSYHSTRDSKRIWFDPDCVRYYSTEKLLDIWIKTFK